MSRLFSVLIVVTHIQRALRILVDKFPGSPRVEVLSGIILENKEPPSKALAYYDELLKEDSSNSVRLCSEHSCITGPDRNLLR